MAKSHPKHASIDSGKMQLNQATFKATLDHVKKDGITLPPVWSIVVCVVLLAIFGVVGYQVSSGAAWTSQLNDNVNTFIHGLRSTELSMAVIPLTTIGDLVPMAAVCFIVLVVLAIRRRWDDVFFVSTNVVAGVLIVQILKRLFAVSRPSAETLVALPASYSFPSAHTSCSLIVLALLALLIIRWMRKTDASKVGQVLVFAGFMLLAVCIGLSRIYVGVHWPTDVLGGWLFGIAWLVPTTALYLKING